MTCRTLAVLAALALGAVPALAQDGSAVYRFTFVSPWSATTHPTSFPSNPHYSPLVGATHDASVELWQPGGIATPGIEQMAETGGTSTLVAEVNQHIQNGGADQVLNYGGAGALGTSPGSVGVTFTARPGHARLSLVTMLAPSPDWFVGVHGVELIQNGDWVESLVLPAHVYDAGTDSGVSYNSPDADLTPHLPIALVSTTQGPFVGASTQVGTIMIERLHSTLVFGCGNPAGSMQVTGSAQLGQTLQFALGDPTGQLPTPAVSGLAISSSPDAAFPCGTSVAGFGLGAGQNGEVLLATIDGLATGPTYSGGSAVLSVPLPNVSALVGQRFYFQGLLASSRVGLTRGVAVRVGN
ncbi:MAG: spondin domain-containing protein [Planctomycetes bacterium]|nr:spondin domain-containing protein [Planctomycetota bacterium]